MEQPEMKKPVVIFGIGEMAGVFARGFLRLGHPVYPITRETGIDQLASQLPEPAAVLVAVAEGDLAHALEQLPAIWAGGICLLQNELLPQDWEGITDPTVISVWFEKKPGMDYKVIIPSPVFGPRARLLADALQAINIPSKLLGDREELLFELVLKNLYILTSNIAGLQVGGTVGQLWERHRELVRDITAEVIALQERLSGARFDHQRLLEAMHEAFEGDPEHKCMGRSAPARLARALEQADGLDLDLPVLRAIASR